jgi:hypothetical protein
MVAVGMAATGILAGGSAPASAGSGCDDSFHVITSPNAASGDTQLANVAAWNTSNAWSVGFSTGGPFSTHWNGASWSEIPVPTIGQQTLPFEVEMAGSHDVWSFGAFKNSHGKFRSLALHKTSGAWARVPTPNRGKGDNDLFTASVIAPDDIWVCGTGTVGGVTEVLVLHWNGIRWTKVAAPAAIGNGDNFLEALTTVGPGDVWITLTYPEPGTGNDHATTFHRVASTWHRVNFAQPSPDGVEPRDMVALGPSAIWMVGFYNVGTKERGLLERYNGSHWVRFTGVNPDDLTFLERVAALSQHDVYAVGGAGSGTIVEHFNGTSWTQVATHDPAGASKSQLNGAAAASSGPNDTRIWATGLTQQPAGPLKTLVEQSCPL